MSNPLQLIASQTNTGQVVAASPTNPLPVNLQGGGTPVVAVVMPLTFSRGGTILSPPAAITVMAWQAPFNCTVTNVRGYTQDVTGTVITAYHGAANLLVANLTLGSAATWLDGGAVQNTAFVTGDTLSIAIVTLSGLPTQIAIETIFTRP